MVDGPYLPARSFRRIRNEIPNHAKAIANHPHLGIVGVTPSNGHFTNTQAASRGEEENLRIEAKAVDGLFLEDRTRPSPMKQLEPTLRIVKLQPHTDAHHAVEHDSTDLAKPGLMPFDRASIDGARPNHDISPIPLRNVVQLLKLVDRESKDPRR